MKNWIYQKDKDIESEIDWGCSPNFDIVFTDGKQTKAFGYLVENADGEVFLHLEDINNDYHTIDTDLILKWKIIK